MDNSMITRRGSESRRWAVGLGVAIAPLLLVLTGCGSNSSGSPTVVFSSTATTPATPAATQTVTTVVTQTPSAAATSTPASRPVTPPPAAPPKAPVINYAQQYMSDIAPWQSAIAQFKSGQSLTSPAVIAAGQAAAGVAQKLLTQTWPAADTGDVHTLALAFDTINEDIRLDNLAKYQSDGTALNADTNVVRAELGVPLIK
jgi:hypothetical protein